MCRTSLSLLALITFASIGCGDSNEVEVEPFTCEPRPADEIEDCVIEAGELAGSSRMLSTQAHLEQVCQSTCSRFDLGVTLRDLPGVTDLTAMQNVRGLPALIVDDTQDLESLKGLENAQFTYEEGQFNGIGFRYNESLETLEGLNLPSTLDGRERPGGSEAGFYIIGNASLRSLKNLEQIEESYNVDWQITDNRALESLDGLRNLRNSTSVGMVIDRNQELKSVELESLETAVGVLVRFNPNLSRLSLPSLQRTDFFVVTENGSLPACQVDAIALSAEVGELSNTGNNTTATCE